MTSTRPAVVRGLALALDVLVIAAAALPLAIAISGGFEIEAAGLEISAHKLTNPLLILYALLAIRLLLVRPTASHAIVSATERALLRLRTVDERSAWMIVGGISLAAMTFKIANAWSHPGFFSGDDLEIQEMSLTHILGWEWRAWDLRSPVYPFAFIYPIQAGLAAAGVSDIESLVASGRTIVAVVSTLVIPLVFLITRNLAGTPAAVFAVCFAGADALHLAFGATELPRPVAAVFVLAAFWLLLVRKPAMAGLAAALAATLRFSEGLFVVAAAIQLACERRTRDIAAFGFAAGVAGLGIQAIGDFLYWGEAFHSFRAIVDYTVVRGLSSRGYEPAWHYAVTVASWTDWLTLGLSAYAVARGHWRPALWFATAFVMLSAMPHHEPRYFVPATPFLSILAGTGLFLALESLVANRRRAASAAFAIVTLCAFAYGSALHKARSSVLDRSDEGVRLAQAASARGVEAIAIDQSFRWGGRLYLGAGVRISEFDTAMIKSPADLTHSALRAYPAWIAIRTEFCGEPQCGAALAAAGYTPAALEAKSYRVFQPAK